MTDLEQAREEFLAMVADAGGLKLEYDGDETGDCSTFSLTTGWSQLHDLIDALGIPDLPSKDCYMKSEPDIIQARIEAALNPDSAEPEPDHYMTNPSSDVVERFFIDHGMIHDRATGKHVDTQPIEYEEGQFDNSPVTETCALLNEQHATIERLSAELGERDAEILRLVDALVFAHDAGIEWPIDPLPFGSIAHNLFIERGNDPDRIAVLHQRPPSQSPPPRSAHMPRR